VKRTLTIINLRDRPLYPRPSYSSRHLKPIEHPRPILSYFVIAGALLYCAVYLLSGLSERRAVLPTPAPPTLARAAIVPILTTPEAPAPDMSSADVRFAEADAKLQHANPEKEPAKIAAKVVPKKRKVHIVATPVAKPREEEPDGWQAYAFSFADHRSHDGGF
jgi:hypothetical protein